MNSFEMEKNPMHDVLQLELANILNSNLAYALNTFSVKRNLIPFYVLSIYHFLKDTFHFKNLLNFTIFRYLVLLVQFSASCYHGHAESDYHCRTP